MIEYEFATRLAILAHTKQKYGPHPYSYHLEQVEMVLNRFGFVDDWDLRIAAWLHDIIEDTQISYDMLCSQFSVEIVDIVYAVTNEMGRNRKERFEKTYPKIKANKKALILKLADRIANIEYSKGANTDFIKMYIREWATFENMLFDANETDKRIITMWNYLKSLFLEE